MPVEKSPRSELPSPLYRFDLLDNVNVCLAGTSVATGSGRALVISTGGETYLASIAKDLTKMRPLNSMQIGIRKVSYLLMAFMVVSLLHRIFSLKVVSLSKFQMSGDGAHSFCHSRSHQQELEGCRFLRHLGRCRSHSR